MTNYRRIARRTARRYGLSPRIFVRQINQESGFNPRARSPVGARGIAQIMPATARGWGVNPDNPRQALDAAARNMASYVRQYGSYENALRAYNAGPGNIQRSHGFSETNRYVANILGGHDPGRLSRSRGGGGGGGSRISFRPGQIRIPGMSNVRIGTRSVFDRKGFEQAQHRAFLSNFLYTHGFRNSVLFRTGVLSTTPPDVADFTSRAITSQFVKGKPTVLKGRGVRGGFKTPQVGPPTRAGLGHVVLAPGADRAGVPTRRNVIHFVSKVSGLLGRGLTIGTGSNHSKYTVNGNVSDHWRGAAVDVPLRGALLIKAGQDALIAAGMNPHQARKKHGGLFNVGRWQIIFNTHIGGDHTNHLHMGHRG